MARNSLITIFAFGVLLLSSNLLPVIAQAEIPIDLTLEQAQELAIKNNPQIQIAEKSVVLGNVKVSEAKRHFKPNVHMGLGFGSDFGNSNQNGLGVGFGFSQDLDRLVGFNTLDRETAEFEATKSKEELRLAKQKIIEEVTKAFYVYQLSKKTFVLRKEQLSTALDNLNKAESRFKLGESSFDVVIASRSETDKLKYEQLLAASELDRAKAALEQLIGSR